MENWKLPLCPKCGDTKYIDKHRNETVFCIPMLDYLAHAKCTRCNLSWELKTTRISIQGTEKAGEYRFSERLSTPSEVLFPASKGRKSYTEL